MSCVIISMRSLLCGIFKTISILFVVWFSDARDVFVTTKYGTLLGRSVSFPQNRSPVKTVNTFLGVPFASPPIGKRRLKPPVPACTWTPIIYNATWYRNVCIQNEIQLEYYRNVWPSFDTKTNIAEDCLYLDIYSPNLKGSYPVMVYVHGGGFKYGASLLWPGYQLALRGVVVVVIQYRLGPLGFLSTGDQELPGNLGLLDQVQALKWVKENIDSFSGNPNLVSLFGAGAGATSVSLHLYSPLSEKLFHRAIIESGSRAISWPMQSTNSTIKRSKALAKMLGCHETRSSELLQCLQRVDNARDFLRAYDLFSSWGLGVFSFGPIVDKSFLPDEPALLRKHGLFHKMPLIVGVTSNETSFEVERVLQTVIGVSNISFGIEKDTFDKYCKEYSHALQPKNTRRERSLLDALLFEYYPWFAAQDGRARLSKLIDMSSDYLYGAPAIATLSANVNSNSTYMYVFNYRSNASSGPSWSGVPHGTSSRYVLGLIMQNSTRYDVIDHDVSDTMVTMWTNMAKYGNPTPTPVQGVTWNQFTGANQEYMSIDGHPVLKMAQNFYGSRAAFWNYYYPRIIKETTCTIRRKNSRSSRCTPVVWTLMVIYMMIMNYALV